MNKTIWNLYTSATPEARAAFDRYISEPIPGAPDGYLDAFFSWFMHYTTPELCPARIFKGLILHLGYQDPDFQ